SRRALQTKVLTISLDCKKCGKKEGDFFNGLKITRYFGDKIPI
ncbi:MAG: hypothetical protein ACI85E_002052, partial [Marinomonas primoryensis]